MSRYILFAGYDFYPDGGVADVRGHGDDLGVLVRSVYVDGKCVHDWYHVLDTRHMIVIFSEDTNMYSELCDIGEGPVEGHPIRVEALVELKHKGLL